MPGEAKTSITHVTNFFKGEAAKERTKIIIKTLTENELDVHLYELTLGIPDVANFEILKNEEMAHDTRKNNK